MQKISLLGEKRIVNRRRFLGFFVAAMAVGFAVPAQAGKKKKIVITGKGGKVTGVKKGSKK